MVARESGGKISIRGRNDPKQSQDKPALHRIAEEEGMLDNTLSTIELINHLDDIVGMAQNGDGSEQTEHIPRTRYKPGRAKPGIILSIEKTKFPRARDRSKRSPLAEKKGNGSAGINPSPITPTRPWPWNLDNRYSKEI